MKKIGYLACIIFTLLAFQIANAQHPIISTKSMTKSSRPFVVQPVDHLFSSVATLDELHDKLKKAKSEGKPVMIEFYASWCPSCRALDTHVFSTPSIQKLLQPFSNIRVDLTRKTDDLVQIAMYYQVYGTPTFIFYDKEGNEFNTERFQDIEELKDILRKLTR